MVYKKKELRIIGLIDFISGLLSIIYDFLFKSPVQITTVAFVLFGLGLVLIEFSKKKFSEKHFETLKYSTIVIFTGVSMLLGIFWIFFMYEPISFSETVFTLALFTLCLFNLCFFLKRLYSSRK